MASCVRGRGGLQSAWGDWLSVTMLGADIYEASKRMGGQ